MSREIIAKLYDEIESLRPAVERYKQLVITRRTLLEFMGENRGTASHTNAHQAAADEV